MGKVYGGMIMRMEVRSTQRENQCQFLRQRLHMKCPGIKPGSPPCKATETLLDLWHFTLYNLNYKLIK